MAILGNQPLVPQSQATNSANLTKRSRATIPGLTPGQYYPAGSQIANGFSFGTPRDWSQGGMQMYDPKYAYAMPQTGGGRTPGPLPTGNYYDSNGAGLSPQSQVMQRANYTPRPSSGGGQVGGSGVPQMASMFGSGTSPNFGGMGMGGGYAAQIGTSITPKAIYDPWMTDVAVNQAVANADQRSNLSDLMGRFDTPGVSRSSRHAALAAPLAAQSQLTAADARARIPFEDTMANQRNMFLGQVARENEMLGLGNLSARMNEARNQDALARIGQSLGYLQSLIG